MFQRQPSKNIINEQRDKEIRKLWKTTRGFGYVIFSTYKIAEIYGLTAARVSQILNGPTKRKFF